MFSQVGKQRTNFCWRICPKISATKSKAQNIATTYKPITTEQCLHEQSEVKNTTVWPNFCHLMFLIQRNMQQNLESYCKKLPTGKLLTFLKRLIQHFTATALSVCHLAEKDTGERLRFPFCSGKCHYHLVDLFSTWKRQHENTCAVKRRSHRPETGNLSDWTTDSNINLACFQFYTLVLEYFLPRWIQEVGIL